MVSAGAPFFIAEAGVNHDGSVNKALRLIDIAADAGADAVKFQTFRAEDIADPSAERAEYQASRLGSGSQLAMLRALELDEAAHARLAKHCVERGIEFMSTPFDAWALAMLVGLGMRRIKVPSGEITNLPLIRAIGAEKLPVVLSTGMADLSEVERAVGWLRDTWRVQGVAPPGLTVLHCTSNYPTAPEDANLAAMATIREALGVDVGFSDHTMGRPVCLAAVALGAKVIEKHFTEDPTAAGPDHAASVDPAELKTLVAEVRAVAAAIGDGVKRPRDSELAVRALVRRSAFATATIEAGETIGSDCVAYRRPAGGVGPEDCERLSVARAKWTIDAGTMIRPEDCDW